MGQGRGNSERTETQKGEDDGRSISFQNTHNLLCAEKDMQASAPGLAVLLDYLAYGGALGEAFLGSYSVALVSRQSALELRVTELKGEKLDCREAREETPRRNLET